MRTIGFLLVLLASTPVGAMAASMDELPDSVRARLNYREIPADTVSIYVADVDTGEVVLNWLGDEPRNPASTLKLMTTLAALDILGPAYRWQTHVFALGPIEDGRLDGDLLLQGTGDPFLVTERVWQLTRALRRTGLEIIDGDLVIDDTYFEVGPYDPGAFDQQPLRAYNVAPNALLMNFKVVRYWFTPDADAGGVRIELDDAELATCLSRCSHEGRGHGMLAPQGEDKRSAPEVGSGLPLDASQGRLEIGLQAILFTIAFATVVGVLSGLYPAIRASRMKPTVAFRHQ